MTITDVKNHLELSLSPKFKVYTEDIEKITRPCLFIEFVDYIPTYDSTNRQKKLITIDIQYFGKGNTISTNPTKFNIMEAMEEIDLSFDVLGKKYLKVLDRGFYLKNQNFNIVDKIGHYMFDIDFFDHYGTEYKYDKMSKLEVEYKYND